jgi:hypothetical protein
LEGEGGLRCTLRLVAVRSGNAEDGEHIAADASIDAPAELGHGLGDPAMKVRGDGVRLLGIELRFQLQQPFEPRHENRGVDQLRADFHRCGRLGNARCLVCRRVVERRVFAVALTERCTPAAHQVAIELLGCGLRCDVELAPQDVATHAVLAQRFGVRIALRVQVHDHAMRCFVERFECNELGSCRECAFAVAVRDTDLGELVERVAQFLAQRQALAREPFVESSGARVEAVEQIASIVRHRFLQRRARACGQCATERMQIAAHDRRVDADRFGVREQGFVSVCRQ